MIESSAYSFSYSAYRVTAGGSTAAGSASADEPAPAAAPAPRPAALSAEGFRYSLSADRASASYFYVSMQGASAASPGTAATPGFGFRPLFDLAQALREFSSALFGAAAQGPGAPDGPAEAVPPAGASAAVTTEASARPAPPGEAAAAPRAAVDGGVDDAPAPAAEPVSTRSVTEIDLSYRRVVYAALKAPRPGSAAEAALLETPVKAAAGSDEVAAASPPAAKGEAASPATTAATAPGADEAPDTGEAGRLIERLGVEDLQRFRLQQRATELGASFSLALTTRDGDEVTLDYTQLDLFERSRFKARGDDGERIRFGDSTSASQRLVALAVTGELDDGERAAIERLFDKLVDVANEFFQGSLKDAVAELKNLEFDGEELAELALQFGRSQSRAALKAYGDADGIERLVSRDRTVSAALEYYADSERTLIEAAGERFAQTSAVKLVRTVLPALVGGELTAGEAAGAGDSDAPEADGKDQRET